ncbi:MAG: GNAT family N-acetyltransferase [Gammaproteobacteria bacterium]
MTDNKQAGEWLEKRLRECAVFAIFANQSENFIGFLFVYGIKEKNKEIRIGYIISEKYWGHGYASEVVGGLVGLMAQEGDVSSIIAGVAKGHMESIKVLTKTALCILNRTIILNFIDTNSDKAFNLARKNTLAGTSPFTALVLALRAILHNLKNESIRLT